MESSLTKVHETNYILCKLEKNALVLRYNYLQPIERRGLVDLYNVTVKWAAGIEINFINSTKTYNEKIDQILDNLQDVNQMWRHILCYKSDHNATLKRSQVMKPFEARYISNARHMMYTNYDEFPFVVNIWSMNISELMRFNFAWKQRHV